ncbi:hypothetical protein GDO86_000436 [Hymenochirus boettgeri]|uniref:Uncharacterized protein n=1 Tax=Hymenochirus boettgeri TaxID=247094 RepID=A0A8T2KEH8_9PIPI|nr:hypothetical protein GDO86_000436 [Hymenochirus boettgeri]
MSGWKVFHHKHARLLQHRSKKMTLRGSYLFGRWFMVCFASFACSCSGCLAVVLDFTMGTLAINVKCILKVQQEPATINVWYKDKYIFN